MSKNHHKRASETRWLYHAEGTALRYNRYAMQDRPINFLRKFMERVWKKEASNKRMPEIWATDGLWDKDRYTSFCCGYTYIELARHHRNILVLLHELTHAMGPCHHGEEFVLLYFHLLNRWAGYSKWFLQQLASERYDILILK